MPQKEKRRRFNTDHKAAALPRHRIGRMARDAALACWAAPRSQSYRRVWPARQESRKT